MKKTLFCLSVAFVFFTFSSCEKDKEELEELGRQAAVEFCECYSRNSKEECLDRLKSKYTQSDYMNDYFISAFNKASTCGAQLEKQQASYPAHPGDALIVE